MGPRTPQSCGHGGWRSREGRPLRTTQPAPWTNRSAEIQCRGSPDSRRSRATAACGCGTNSTGCSTCGIGVTIEDDTGVRWTFCHGNALHVQVGDVVDAGMQILTSVKPADQAARTSTSRSTPPAAPSAAPNPSSPHSATTGSASTRRACRSSVVFTERTNGSSNACPRGRAWPWGSRALIAASTGATQTAVSRDSIPTFYPSPRRSIARSGSAIACRMSRFVIARIRSQMSLIVNDRYGCLARSSTVDSP